VGAPIAVDHVLSVDDWMSGAAAAIEAEADHLTQLDSAIGDGDHGINMTRGMRAVLAALDGADDVVAPGKRLILAGKTLVSTVGGASGPLWGSALRRGGRALGDAEALDGPALVTALEAEPGDKTMVDALGPAVAALRERLDAGDPLPAALAAAADAAEEGARATIPMQARKGRASYLGERSVGHQDPGATSTALIVRALGGALVPPG
jgi:dihydroxyacetone kinase-like protein